MSIQKDFQLLEQSILHMQEDYQYKIERLEYSLNMYQQRFDDLSIHLSHMKLILNTMITDVQTVHQAIKKLQSTDSYHDHSLTSS